MSNSISLTASMRSNLLSLQNIVGQVDLTQNRLSTGLKVNSAIDNPSSYYTAVSLSNRAGDLSSLLDSMAQGIQTIKAATEGLQAGASLLEQAAATATQALETVNLPPKSWFAEQEGVTAVVSTKEELLTAINSGKSGDIVIYGQIDMGNTRITLKEGQNLTGIGTYGVTDNERGKFSALNFDVIGTVDEDKIICLTTSGNIADLSICVQGDAAEKTLDLIKTTSSKTKFFKNLDVRYEVQNRGGEGAIISGSGRTIDKVCFQGTNNFYAENINVAFYGFHLTTQPETTINAFAARGAIFRTMNVEAYSSEINVHSQNYLDYQDVEIICYGTTRLNGYKNYASHLTLNDQSRVDNAEKINSGSLTLTSAAASFHVKGEFLLTAGIIDAVAGSKISLNGQIYQAKKDIYQDTDSQTSGITPPEYQKVEGETYTQPDSEFLKELSVPQTYQKKTDGKQYGEIIKQYDSLIKDSSYKGINLLHEQNLTVTFNESRSAQLAVQGKDASAQALGLVTTDWQDQGDVVKSIQELTEALNQIRQMNSELGNYYSIVTTRENFTQNLINVLTEGADKLTLADMNEESANMLALQTRQQLAVNSLSLASQASQSILKLF